MGKNKEQKTILGLSSVKAIALILVIVAVFGVVFAVYHVKKVEKVLPTPEIVTTKEVIKPEVEIVDSEDIIGDFILDHEYFAADVEVLDSEPELKEETIEVDEKRVVLEKLDIETPLIAVVIDDMGINRKRTLDIISIEAPLTSSFLTYGSDLNGLAQKAKAAGHEIMIHAPMEPKVEASLAPDTLRTDMTRDEIEDLFSQMINKFADIKVSGINNHMGSKFTEDETSLGYVMDIIKEKGMFFLDSKTTSVSKGKELAVAEKVNFAQRDVFLDNENNYDYILNQLQKAENIAGKKGFAIAICHPKSQTYPALKDWVESLKDKNIKLVHVSEIVGAINK